MRLRPEPLPPIPDATAAAVRAALPTGNLYVALRAEFGTLSTAQLCAALSPPEGRPVEVAPWRLALVLGMQEREGLTDRQAAEAVQRCMDGNEALSLDVHAPGVHCPLVHDVRDRVLAHAATPRLLDTCLATCTARGWIKARGTQRTDAPPVRAAMRPLHRRARVLATLHAALDQRSAADAAWVRQPIPREW